MLAALGATVTLPCAQAQAPEPLQSVVTVASRLPQTADRLTADAVVITREQLALLPADNLADALQALAGVQVSRTGGPGQPTSVLIRGAAASNTLVLVDGVRMGSATLGQFDFSTIGLAGIVEHVTLIEFADQLKADAVLVDKLKSLPNVTIHVNAQTTEITGDGSKVNGLKYKDRATGTEHLVALEGVFVQIGLVPNTEFLKDTVDLSKFGEIVVDAKGHTNVPGVFAAGDCTTVPYKQIVIAAGEGAKAALSAFDHLIRS